MFCVCTVAARQTFVLGAVAHRVLGTWKVSQWGSGAKPWWGPRLCVRLTTTGRKSPEVRKTLKQFADVVYRFRLEKRPQFTSGIIDQLVLRWGLRDTLRLPGLSPQAHAWHRGCTCTSRQHPRAHVCCRVTCNIVMCRDIILHSCRMYANG